MNDNSSAIGLGIAAGVGILGGLLAYAFGQEDKKKKPREVYLYHYTDAEGVSKIRKSRRIRMSRAARQDAYYGDGVYLTSLHPKSGMSTIAVNNYGWNTPVTMRKVQYYFCFRRSDLSGVREVKDSRDIWLYSSDICLDDVLYSEGETESEGTLSFNEKTGALVRVQFK